MLSRFHVIRFLVPVIAGLTILSAASMSLAGDAKKVKTDDTPVPHQATTMGGVPRSEYRYAVKEFRVADSISYPGWYGYQNGLNSAVCDMLTTEMSKQGRDMVERQRIGDVLGEQDLGGTGRLDPNTAAPIGKILGADYLILGTITEWGMKERGLGGSGLIGGMFGGARVSETTARVKIDYHVVNAKTGRIVGGSAGTAMGEDTNRGVSLQKNWYNNINFNESEWTSSQIGKATRKAVQQIAQQLSAWSPNDGGAEPDRPAVKATIVAVLPSDEIIIDKGQHDDIRVGDTMDVVGLSAVKNAAGKTVYQTETVIGSAKVIEVQDGGGQTALYESNAEQCRQTEGGRRRPHSCVSRRRPLKIAFLASAAPLSEDGEGPLACQTCRPERASAFRGILLLSWQFLPRLKKS